MEKVYLVTGIIEIDGTESAYPEIKNTSVVAVYKDKNRANRVSNFLTEKNYLDHDYFEVREEKLK
jgi:hypothetical protein